MTDRTDECANRDRQTDNHTGEECETYHTVKSSQELLPETHEAERSRKNTLAGCVSACDAPAAGRLRGLSVRARARRDTCTCAGRCAIYVSVLFSRQGGTTGPVSSLVYGLLKLSTAPSSVFAPQLYRSYDACRRERLVLLVGARKYERSGGTPIVCTCCAGLATADRGRPPFFGG